VRTRAARLEHLERRLEGKLQRLQGVAFTLYQRGVMRDECHAIFRAFEAGDQAEVERIFFEDITPRSPEWRQLWAAYDATYFALAACGRVGPAFINSLADNAGAAKHAKP